MFELNKRTRGSSIFGASGCAFLLISSVFATVLLLVNSFVISGLYPPNSSTEWDLLKDARFRQTVMFVGPALLLIVQWWLIDLIVDWWGGRRRSSDDGAGRQSERAAS